MFPAKKHSGLILKSKPRQHSYSNSQPECQEEDGCVLSMQWRNSAADRSKLFDAGIRIILSERSCFTHTSPSVFTCRPQVVRASPADCPWRGPGAPDCPRTCPRCGYPTALCFDLRPTVTSLNSHQYHTGFSQYFPHGMADVSSVARVSAALEYRGNVFPRQPGCVPFWRADPLLSLIQLAGTKPPLRSGVTYATAVCV